MKTPIKWNIDLVRDFVKENGNGDELVSEEYNGTKNKIKIKCHICNCEYDIVWGNYLVGKRHGSCSAKLRGQKRKFSYEFVKKYIEENDCELISKEYVDNHKKLEIKFSCGHIGFRSFSKFKDNKKICPKCVGVQKYTYDEMKNYIESVGYHLLSNDFFDSSKRLTICDAIGYKYEISFNSFHNHSISRGNNLNKFDKSNPFTIDNIGLFLKINSPDFHLSDGQMWHGNSYKMSYYDDFGYKYYVEFYSLQDRVLNSSRPDRFHVSNIYTLENIEKWLILNDKPYSLVPGQKYVGAGRYLKFKCHICHEDENPFDSDMGSLVSGKGCPICANVKRGKYNNLTYLYPEIAKEWDYKKNFPLTPEDIAPFSGKKYYWICQELGHSYYMQVSCKTGPDKCKCNICDLSKGEVAIKKFLNNNKIKYKHEFRFNDCRYKNPLPFDFYLSDYNICVEMQGVQHFKPIDFFGGEENFELQKIKDKIKYDYCKNNKIKLVYISYLEFDEIELILSKELDQTF
jgi:hypothetical protein